MTAFEQFKNLCTKGNVVPVFDTLLADTETPVSVYLKLKDESPYSFLLESIEGGEKLARYSFLGFDPFMIFEIHGKQFRVTPRHQDVQVAPKLVQGSSHPLDALKNIFAHFKSVSVPGLPRLSGGAVGYFGYESVQLVENVPLHTDDALHVPDAMLMFYDTVVIFDNVMHRLFIVSNAYIPTPDVPDADLRREYTKAVAEIERFKELLKKDIAGALTRHQANGSIIHEFPQKQFFHAVERVKRYIADGDIFQAVLSQKLRRPASVPPFDVYREIRLINPSPYMYFLNMGGFSVIGSSPEMLVRVDRGTVETRPIAGTRRRGATAAEDAVLERELMNDAKERAEHLMLVDLGRNDLGRISEFGSVEVTELMAVERYSHVMHIVSSVKGKLRKDLSAIDALFACFPAGTLTGAPKIRAMEIITELEPSRRGVYGGAVGYIDFSGNLDSCIAIRTIVAKDGILHFQAGAGIVHDSTPEREFQETMEKLAANLKAVEMLTS
ncbi:MAG: anthranilate synthase component I [Ignavibacteriales bacterium]|nr:anthranilate synthase component I [Ignavibacteriales bacterium]